MNALSLTRQIMTVAAAIGSAWTLAGSTALVLAINCSLPVAVALTLVLAQAASSMTAALLAHALPRPDCRCRRCSRPWWE